MRISLLIVLASGTMLVLSLPTAAYGQDKPNYATSEGVEGKYMVLTRAIGQRKA